MADLAERMTLQQSASEVGKAGCVVAALYRRCSLNINLANALQLQLPL